MRVKTIVYKEWGNLSRDMDTIIIGKFHHGKEIHPIFLLVVDCTLEVLFEDLVDSLGLAIRLRVICC